MHEKITLKGMNMDGYRVFGGRINIGNWLDWYDMMLWYDES